MTTAGPEVDARGTLGETGWTGTPLADEADRRPELERVEL